MLLDCGLFQGHQEASGKRNALAFDPTGVSAVVISHAHLDHIGLLPVLVKQGFTGPIFSTSATRDLAELILLDAAKLQEQDAAYARRKQWPGAELVVPLYTPDDILAVMARWRSLPYVHDQADWQPILPGVEVKLYDAGHILGSAVILVHSQDGSLAFSGDLGRTNAPLLRDPDPIREPIGTLILEATYGSREHRPVDSVKSELIRVIRQAIAQRGKIVVPAFSLGRTQELVYILHQLTDQGLIPRIPIYVDSPLASRITAVFTRHQRQYDAATKTDFRLPGEDPLIFRNLHYTHSVEESKALNSLPGPIMIISASGMATGGRILHHLANTISDPNTIVLFTGYQGQGTVGRHLVDGMKTVRLFGQSLPVRAEVAIINDLSAHADARELETYAAGLDGLRRIFLVHAEPDRAEALAQRLTTNHPNWQVTIPQIGQSFEI